MEPVASVQTGSGNWSDNYIDVDSDDDDGWIADGIIWNPFNPDNS